MSETSKDPKMIVLKCPQCGGALELDPDKEIAACPYCKTRLLIVRSIEQNNVINYNIRIEDNGKKKPDNRLPFEKPDPDRINEIMRFFMRAAAAAAVIVALGLLFKACGAMIGALQKGGQNESEEPAAAEEGGQAAAPAEAEETGETLQPAEPEGRVIEVPRISSDTMEVDPIVQEKESLPNARIEDFPISFSQEGQETSFDVTIPDPGNSCLSIAEKMSDMQVRVRVYDEKGEEINTIPPGSDGYGIKIKTSEPNEKLTVRVFQYKGLGDFIIRFGMPKPVKDLGNTTILSDYIDYDYQTNTYTLTAGETGEYSFYVNEMKADMSVKIDVSDRLGKTVNAGVCWSGNGLATTLTAGEIYTIKVSKREGLGSYNLLIGRQKKTVDLESNTHVRDSTEFMHQRNCYTFTAKTDGDHRVEMTDFNSNDRFKLEVYDRLDYEINGMVTNAASNSGMMLTGLKAGETYRIYVDQREGFGTYLLSVYRPKDVVEITEGDIIRDSVEFSGQINTYSFTASREGDATFSISELGGERRVGVFVYNDLDEQLYSESFYENGDYFTITDLKPGAHFRICILEKNGSSDYTLTVN